MDEVKRMNYYDGLFLKEDDFITEQNYNIRMRRLMNWYLNRVYGILEGLDVKPLEGKKYKITPGIAISNTGEGKWYGTEIVFSSEYPLDLSNKPPGDYYITITYDEVKGDDDTSKGSDKIHWIERPKPDIQSKLPDSPEKEIVLAKINVPAGDWTSNVKYLNFDDRKEIGPALRCINNKVIVGTPDQSATLEVNGDIKAKNTDLQNLSVQENVGIGTKNPQAGLHIDKADTNDLALKLSSNGPGWGSGILFKNNEKAYGIYVGIDTKFRICDMTNDRLIIDADGNVGIGTNNPISPLTIRSTGELHELISFEDTDGKNKWHICHQRNDKYGLIFDESGKGQRLFLQEGGNVGIGTLDPKDKLDVDGNILVRGNVGIGTDNPSAKLTVFGAIATVNIETTEIMHLQRDVAQGVKNANSAALSLGSFEVGVDGRARLDFNLSGSPSDKNNWGSNPDVNVMSLLANGNVGIGTPSPEDTFQVGSGCAKLVTGAAVGESLWWGTSYIGFNAGRTRTNNTWKFDTDTSHNGGAVIHSSIDGDLFFSTVQTNKPENAQILTDGEIVNGMRLVINSAGLDVKGDIKVSGKIIQEDWKLMSPLLNGWKEYGYEYNSPGYFLDKSGIVHLKGLLTGGNIGSNAPAIFVLPENYRPSVRELHIVASYNPHNTEGDGFGRCDILPDGSILPYSGNSGWFSLDGITFRAK